MVRNKIMLGVAAIATAAALVLGTSSFDKKPEAVKEPVTKVADVIYRYDGQPNNQTDFEDETKWVQVANTSGLSCGAAGNICYIQYADNGASLNPATLPSGFDPTDYPHDTKAAE